MRASQAGRLPALRALRGAVVAGLAAAALLGVTAVTGPAAAAEGTVHVTVGAQPVPGRYLVLFRTDRATSVTSSRTRTDQLAERYSARVRHRYSSAVQGFAAEMTPTQARRIAADPAVARVEQDSVVRISATQTDATWGLDRVDQRSLPLTHTYTYTQTASNVSAYVIDTGIQTAHTDFGGRATLGVDTSDSFPLLGRTLAGEDCNGHGTHVAGTLGGTRYGIAKKVRLIGVRVLDCSGSGSTSAVIAGVDWVKQNAHKPAVANMSLGGAVSSSLDAAVRSAISSGVTFVLAAGNADEDACNTSPARVGPAITVGATTSADARAAYSNYGPCLDVFAPGSGITSDWNSSNTATETVSGTSMASTHVAGAAALYLARHPSASPAAVHSALVGAATQHKVTNPGPGSSNRLLYTASL
jgi:subtilisin family serine protease